MIPPRKIAFEAKKKEKENLRFRTFLKCNAEEAELDRQFAKLHEEVFAAYDCSRCRNCCKSYLAEFAPEEVARAAECLEMGREEFVGSFLDKQEAEGTFLTKATPCVFLQEDGGCRLGECKPDNCVKYPFTDQPGRLESLYGVLDAVSVCPAAFEIWERLKEMYGFR